MLIRLALVLFLLGVAGACAATPAAKTEIPYKTYVNVTMNTVGVWMQTEIRVPRGAMVAVMAEGECWNVKQPMKKHLDPTACVRFRIGERGVRRNLVTLSACETGLARGTKGGFPQGDDLVGLSRAFIHAGAPSVVASLWKVSDESTVVMMRSFYRNLKTMSKAEALRQAQLGLAKSDTMTSSHPYFWAPFILVGDWK